MLKEKSEQKQRINLFGVQIDAVTMQETVLTIFQWVDKKESLCKFVITPNVDHIVQVQDSHALQAAYKKAALVITDGKPVKWAANLLGVNIPETVPGSDLVPEIFKYAQSNQKTVNVFLLGAMPGVAEKAKSEIHQQWPLINVVGLLSPEFGFEKSEHESQAICTAINNANPDILVIGLGAPKQELWVTKHASRLSVDVALCVGATIDFLANEKPRAPMWMRKCGLEWVHRLLSEPKRLAKRYFTDAVRFPRIVFREWLLRKR